jgi:hypothetical protein
MTKQQYEKLTRQARDKIPTIENSVKKKIQTIYQKASDDLAERVASLPAESFDLYIQTDLQLSLRLQQAADDIANALNSDLSTGVQQTAEKISAVNKKYLIETGFDAVQISTIIQDINTQAVTDMVNRVWQDGYSFSQRVWKIGAKYQDDIKTVLSAGFAQGRDPFQIAKDLQEYTVDGKTKLMKRYGKLQAGARDFTQRIPQNVDYRAIRLVRTEIYNSMRDVQVMGGEANPGCTGLYNWIRQFGAADYSCACPSLAAGSPYKADEIPSNPHPNCSCYIQAVLRNQTDFVNDLVKWKDGADIDYLDEWASKYGYGI